MLGTMNYNGTGISQNYINALNWYTKSANGGNADAQYMLGKMYYNGTNINTDYIKALKWFKKSESQNNNPEIQKYIGNIYYEEAIKWFEKSEKQCNLNNNSGLFSSPSRKNLKRLFDDASVSNQEKSEVNSPSKVHKT